MSASRTTSGRDASVTHMPLRVLLDGLAGDALAVVMRAMGSSKLYSRDEEETRQDVHLALWTGLQTVRWALLD